MAVIRRGTLSGAVVLALATGIPIGCGSDACDASCDPIGASVRVETPDPLRITVCVDEDCRDLDDGRRFEAGEVVGGFSGWQGVGLRDEEVHIRVAVRDESGVLLATFDDTREPAGDADCCGKYVAFRFDGDSLEWWDE